MNEFVHLNVNAPYAEERKSIIKPRQLFQYAKEQGVETVGVTECGSSYSIVDVMRLAEQFQMQPIFSTTFSIKTEKGEGYRVLLFPAHENGIRELWHCINLANEGTELNPNHLKTLQNLAVVLDLEGIKEENEMARVYRMWEGNRTYIGMKGTGSPLANTYNEVVRKWIREGVFSVILTDVLYMEAVHAKAQSMWENIVSDVEVTNLGRHFKTDEELSEIFTKEELQYNQQFVSTIQLKMPPKQKPEYPKVKVPNKLRVPMNLWAMFDTPEWFVPPTDEEKVREIAYLVGLAYDGLYKKYEGSELFEAAYLRMREELGQFIAKGSNNFFLVVQEFCEKMQKDSIPKGPGRGSAAGSLLVYCLDITEVCPIENDLYLARFDSLDRGDLADIDVDMSALRKHEVYHHVEDTYGKKRVAKTMTHNSYGWNPALRDVGKRLGIKPYLIRKLENTKWQLMYDKETGIVNPTAYEVVVEYPELKELLDIAISLVGLPRSTSFHPSAVIISASDLADKFPVVYKRDEECGWIYGIQLNDDAKQLEWFGEPKYDMLSSIACDILASVRKKSGLEVLPNDQRTFEMFKEGNSVATFQLDSMSMRKTLVGLKPETIMMIVLVLSLNRPGAFQYIDYCIRKKMFGQQIQEEREYLAQHSALREILKETKGLLATEEQVREIICVWTGCNPEHAQRWMKGGGIAEFLEVEEILNDEEFEEELMEETKEQSESKEEKVKVARQWFYEQAELAGWEERETEIVYNALYYFSRYDIIREHPEIQPLLKETYGVPVYQEQIMELLKVWAGYSLADADLVRRIMSKKKVEEMEREKERFLRKSEENGREWKLSLVLFRMIERFAKYGFNKSHAVAYALQAYRMGYFKAHVPQLFLSETLNLLGKDKKDKIPLYLEEMYKFGLQKPDIRTSKEMFVPEGDKIHFGLKMIKGLSQTQVRLIEIEREKKPFQSFGEMYFRLKGVLNDASFTVLIKAGALDCFGDRMNLLKQLETQQIEDSLQFHLLPFYKDDVLRQGIPVMEVQRMEREAMFYSTVSDPMEEHQGVLKYIQSLQPGGELVRVMRAREHVIQASRKKMGFLSVKAEGWKDVAVFEEEWQKQTFQEWDVAVMNLTPSKKAKKKNDFVLNSCRMVRTALVLNVNRREFASCREYQDQNGIWHLLYCEGDWKAISAQQYEEVKGESLHEKKIRFV